MEQPTPTQLTNPVQADPVQVAPITASAEQPAPVEPAAAAKPAAKSVAELEAAHARSHKRLTIIETIGTVLLVFFALAAAAGWAYYQQPTKASGDQPYGTNEYQ